MRINARHLRGDVGAQAQLAATDLIDHTDGFERQAFVDTGEQGIAVFQQGRAYQLVAVHAEKCQQLLLGTFQLACGGGQDVGNVFRQLPGLHKVLAFVSDTTKAGIAISNKSAAMPCGMRVFTSNANEPTLVY